MNFPIPFVCVDNKARADAKAALTVATSGSNAAVAAQATANEALALARNCCVSPLRITKFVCTRYDANNFIAEWDISDTPPNLTGFHIYAKLDGAPYRPITSFDANERTSTFGNPPFTATADMYIVAHESGVPITLPSPVLHFTAV